MKKGLNLVLLILVVLLMACGEKSVSPVGNDAGSGTDGTGGSSGTSGTFTQEGVQSFQGKTDELGSYQFTSSELSKPVKVTVTNASGEKLQNIEVSAVAKNGRTMIMVYDETDTYAPYIYMGDPVVEANSSILGNRNINASSINAPREIFILGTTIALFSVVMIAKSQIDIAFNQYKMAKLEMGNEANVSESYTWYRLNLAEFTELVKLKLANLVSGTSIAISVATLTPSVSSAIIGIGTMVSEEYINNLISKIIEKENLSNIDLDGYFYVKEANTRIKRALTIFKVVPSSACDPYEPNNSMGKATELSRNKENSLIIFDDDVDYFKTYANANNEISVKIDFKNSNGDLDLELYSPSGMLLQRSNSTSSDSEKITFNSGSTPGYYYVKVLKKVKNNSLSVYNIEFSSVGGTTSSLKEIRIVLSWGQNPSDLDAHLWTPRINGTIYHTYYRSKYSSSNSSTVPYNSLDVDDISSYGPETITIYKMVEGKYYFSVHHYAGSSSLPYSGACVKVYGDNALLKTFTAPSGTASSKYYWHVFSIDGTTGVISGINSYSTSIPTQVSSSSIIEANTIDCKDKKQINSKEEGR